MREKHIKKNEKRIDHHQHVSLCTRISNKKHVFYINWKNKHIHSSHSSILNNYHHFIENSNRIGIVPILMIINF